MSTSTIHQQSLADAGSETRPSMLERGSYIPWASRFRRYLNQKRENRKWLNKAIDEGPYVFKNFTPEGSKTPTLQTEDDWTRHDLKHFEAEIEAMNFILISIPNDIYNSVDACTTAQAMWQRVERLTRGTVQNVGTKSLLEVTAVKLLLLVLKVNAAGIKVTTAERINTAQRKDKDCLWDMYEIFL
ncbi:hypothetical protein Tco_0143744 [Tanacetum coccineum]